MHERDNHSHDFRRDICAYARVHCCITHSPACDGILSLTEILVTTSAITKIENTVSKLLHRPTIGNRIASRVSPLPIMASHKDELAAAVHAKMDPITLLVWCEQSLSPKELPTLNRLLKEDDGTLVQEIGWNLLEIVLPMLKDDRPEASKCLECIARRGNPREVIVKVAEVLEKLGEETDYSEDEADSVDELPTFAGEADRIHLGTLTLDGMPGASHSKVPDSEEAENEQKPDEGQPVGHSVSLSTLGFESLMSMLGILHMRIKTQYPSRFLATSLPAALGAYRRIGVTSISTMSFLSFLSKLSGRRPQLPPRAHSVAASEPQAVEASAPRHGPAMISLPDSEPEVEGSSMQQASQNEKDIVLRLLQAVLSEALDDYMASLQSRDPSYMSWTTRLREKYEPRRTVPGKTTESLKWKQSNQLSERDRVIDEFLAVSKDLNLDTDQHFKDLLDENGQLRSHTSNDDEAESPSDYPTKPSQIPFPPSGILFLCAAQKFSSHTAAISRPDTDDTLTSISRDYQFFRSDQNAAYLHASFATEDALLSLLYLIKDKPQPASTAFDFKSFFMSLASFCAQSPDPQLRDTAHGIATTLFHNCPEVSTKLNLVTTILKHETTPVNLKAVAIGWVKDDISKSSVYEQDSIGQLGINPSDIESNPTLFPLLFPDYKTSNSTQPEARIYNIAELSYYIASLNLIFVLASKQPGPQSSAAMVATIAGLEHWRITHRGLENHLADDGSHEIRAALDEYRMDLWALDDALGRSGQAIRAFTTS